MDIIKQYIFNPKENGILVNCTIKGPNGIIEGVFILDTGATFTTVTPEFLNRVGYSKDDYIGKIKTSTANGLSNGWLLQTISFGSLGLIRNNFQILIINLPLNLFVDGLLGQFFFK